VYFTLREKPEGAVTLAFLDARGNLIKSFSNKDPERPPKETGAKEEPKVPAEAGLNRFIWNMRYPDARNVPGAIYRSGDVSGPFAPPGDYQVRLTVGDTIQTEPFTIRKDPRVTASDADLHAQFALLLKMRDKLSETNDAINQLRSLRTQIEDWEKRSSSQQSAASGQQGHSALSEAAKTLKEGLAAVEEELVQTSWKSSRDALTAPSKLNAKLATLANVVGGSDAAPTTQAQEVFAALSERLDAQFERLDTLIRRDVPRFNALVQEQNLPALTVMEIGEGT
jgi:hypothetical protein